MAIPDIMVLNFNSLTELAPGHPVYTIKVTFKGVEHTIVIKGELFTTGNINECRYSLQYLAHLYARVTSSFTETRLLKSHEIASIMQKMISMQLRGPDPRAYPTMVWYAMQKLANLYDLKCIEQRDDWKEMKSVKTQLAKAMRFVQDSPECMQELGRIWAVDAFNGNQDRFSQPMANGPWMVQNWGNIFLTTNADLTEVTFSGIDFYEAGNQYGRLFKPYAQCAGAGPWIGENLRDNKSKARDAISCQLIDACNKAFQQRRVDWHFGIRHLEQFRQGMEAGRTALKQVLKADVKAGEYDQGEVVPSGIASRVKQLGW